MNEFELNRSEVKGQMKIANFFVQNQMSPSYLFRILLQCICCIFIKIDQKGQQSEEKFIKLMFKHKSEMLNYLSMEQFDAKQKRHHQIAIQIQMKVL